MRITLCWRFPLQLLCDRLPSALKAVLKTVLWLAANIYTTILASARLRTLFICSMKIGIAALSTGRGQQGVVEINSFVSGMITLASTSQRSRSVQLQIPKGQYRPS